MWRVPGAVPGVMSRRSLFWLGVKGGLCHQPIQSFRGTAVVVGSSARREVGTQPETPPPGTQDHAPEVAPTLTTRPEFNVPPMQGPGLPCWAQPKAYGTASGPSRMRTGAEASTPSMEQAISGAPGGGAG